MYRIKTISGNKFANKNVLTATPFRQRGVSLIEVLVTVLILSTSLLALAGLQTRSLQFNQGAYFRSQANIMAYDILDRMRINADNFAAYVVTAADNPPQADTPRAAVDLYEWRSNISAALPNGVGAIACDADALCTVTITWSELNNSGQVLEDSSSFSYSARI